MSIIFYVYYLLKFSLIVVGYLVCTEGGTGAGEGDIDEVLLVPQPPEGRDHGRVEVVPPQRVLLLAADRGAAC